MRVGETGRLRVALFFLHSYNGTGAVRVGCGGTCVCRPFSYSTRWGRTYSGGAERSFELNATSGGAGAGGGAGAQCSVTLVAESAARVKLLSVRLEQVELASGGVEQRRGVVEEGGHRSHAVLRG